MPYGKLIITLSGVALIAVWLFLSGAILLIAFDKDPNNATPLTLYQYWYYYQDNHVVQTWIYRAALIALAIISVPVLALLASPNKRKLFGEARFAKRADIQKAGLLGDKGIIVGQLGSRYLMFGGQQHAIISAPTRSGKGVGIVIPNLLNWPESVVVLDIKQENWDVTSGYRKKHGQACFLFNPAAADYRTHRYNPLAYISSDPNFRIDDVQKIANMLFPDVQGTDVIWTATPRSLFLGIVLYLAETPEKPLTLGQVVRETLKDGDGSQYFATTINARAAAGSPLSNACVRALNSYISISAENTRAGIMTSFRSRLELWLNPLVDAATSANDFDLRDVRKKKMSVYLGVTPDNLERMAPLLNLFFQQLIDLNTRELPNQNKQIKYSCLLLMDEFTAIGKIGILSKGISYIAGYGLRMLPIIQSPAQLVDVYGADAAQTFTTNHALNIIFPPKASETQTAKDISEWLGYETVKSVSQSRSRRLFKQDNDSNSTSEQQRALMLPQEITSLGQRRELIIMENVPPILADKVIYFKDTVFVDRLKKISSTLHGLGRNLPTQKQMDEAIGLGELAASVPVIDLDAHHKATGGDEMMTVSVPKGGGSGMSTMKRPITANDIENLGNMKLEDFAMDFSSVKKPPPGEMDETALKAYADDLCRAMGMQV
ncbi:MAG: type IV secretion protein [Betaproteobacteria bacterium HGW-Betaproteobacteria-22]|nr:MAG: type IV secretion protein [Betaproteobacteria bacterium HGW-Betaproteobacteria-22]